jgi:hypothetical protein
MFRSYTRILHSDRVSTKANPRHCWNLGTPHTNSQWLHLLGGNPKSNQRGGGGKQSTSEQTHTPTAQAHTRDTQEKTHELDQATYIIYHMYHI